MRIDVLSYSMTGNTAAVCAAVAEGVGAEPLRLGSPLSGAGVWGMMKLGFMAVLGRDCPVEAPRRDWAAAELLVLGAPVWAGRVAVPMRSWLRGAPALPERVALVMTGGQAGRPDKAFAAFADLAARPVAATLHVNEKTVKAGDFTADVSRFCAELTSARA